MSNLVKTEKQAEKERAIDYLKGLLKDNPTIYGTCMKVSGSGMSRTLKLFVVVNNQPVNISWNVTKVLGTRKSDLGVVVEGCGMDMLFSTVYNLNGVLFPERTNTDVNYSWF